MIDGKKVSKAFVTIVLVFEDGESYARNLDYANVDILEEIGYREPENLSRRHMMPNGHRRACIKLWDGCEEYDDFVKEG